MAPGMFVLAFGLWLEREESGRAGSASAVCGVELPFTGIGKPVGQGEGRKEPTFPC